MHERGTQPGLPLKKGSGPTMTHDYKRNSTTTLFTALNVLDGSIKGLNMQRHRHQEFIRLRNQIERDAPKDKPVHVTLPFGDCMQSPVGSGQLLHPQTCQGARLAGAAPTLDVPLHPDIVVRVERS